MKVEPSSGNVFADLGLPNADELKALADMKARGLFAGVSWSALVALLRSRDA
jgi:hypothetical protein